MGATASRVIRIQAPPEVAYRAAEAALAAMGLQVAERIPDRKYLAASIPISLWSVGERIEILVDPAEAGSSRVSVTSTFKSPWQRANLAKTDRNIDTFEAALLKQVSLADALGTTVRQPSQDIRIFISYRRDDSGATAGRIYDDLISALGAPNVFKDVYSIPLGMDYLAHLERQIVNCTALLAVIGPRWLTISASTVRRLDDPNDVVRSEITSALRFGIRVVPVLVEGGKMPDAALLPPDLVPLTRRQGVEVRQDPFFHDDVRRMILGLGKGSHSSGRSA
jgi:hypothetical protein